MDIHRAVRLMRNENVGGENMHGSMNDLRPRSNKQHSLQAMATLSRSRPDIPNASNSRSRVPRVPSMSTIPHESLTPKNEEWNSIQTAIISLFQQKKLEDGQLSKLLENIRNMISTDVGPFIYEYFKKQLLKRGMVIMRESIKGLEGQELMRALGELWSNFYKEILPMLQVLLHPVQTTDQSVRQVSLLTFRDVVVLKLYNELQDAFNETTEVVLAIRQMLLVLQGVFENFPPSENRLQLEGLVGLAVNPYIGFKGIYYGSSKPVIKANEEAYRKKSSTTKPPNPPLAQLHHRQMSIDVPMLTVQPPQKLGHKRQSSIPNINPYKTLLRGVLDTGRRSSYEDVF